MINEQCVAEAQTSMQRAREVLKCYDALPGDIVVNSGQRRGFSSLFGVTFVIEHEVLDYEVMSKFCAACKSGKIVTKSSRSGKKNIRACVVHG